MLGSLRSLISWFGFVRFVDLGVFVVVLDYEVLCLFVYF